GPRYRMYSLTFTPDGRKVVTGDDDADRTWDAADGRLFSVKVRSPSTIAYPLYSPGGQWVAFTEDDAGQTVTCIGDVASGRLVRRLPDKDQCPVAVSPDGRRLATFRASHSETPEDKVLTVWDVATGAKVGRLKLGGLSMYAQALAPDGRTVFA